MQLKLFVVDAFTAERFKGNPAAVVSMTSELPDSTLQAIASEMNLSETAFVYPAGNEGSRRLRWFTPAAEVDLCGHATLAATHVMGASQTYVTRSGRLVCVMNNDGLVTMSFPADPPREVDPPEVLLKALPGVEISGVYRGISDVLVHLAGAAELRTLTPDFELLGEVPARGVITTASGDRSGVDFVSRCFYEAIGVREDPVTGSAHCTLASWWGPRLDKLEMVGEQASARGGRVHVRLSGDRVELSGRAVTVVEGQLFV